MYISGFLGGIISVERVESHSFNIFALFKNHYSTIPRIPPNIFNAPFPVKPLILFCNKIITIRIFYKTVIRSETEIIVLTTTLSWNWRICHVSLIQGQWQKRNTYFFLFFFLQTDKWSAKIMFARNALFCFCIIQHFVSASCIR